MWFLLGRGLHTVLARFTNACRYSFLYLVYGRVFGSSDQAYAIALSACCLAGSLQMFFYILDIVSDRHTFSLPDILPDTTTEDGEDPEYTSTPLDARFGGDEAQMYFAGKRPEWSYWAMVQDIKDHMDSPEHRRYPGMIQIREKGNNREEGNTMSNRIRMLEVDFFETDRAVAYQLGGAVHMVKIDGSAKRERKAELGSLEPGTGSYEHSDEDVSSCDHETFNELDLRLDCHA
jgi:hypothetical protein